MDQLREEKEMADSQVPRILPNVHHSVCILVTGHLVEV